MEPKYPHKHLFDTGTSLFKVSYFLLRVIKEEIKELYYKRVLYAGTVSNTRREKDMERKVTTTYFRQIHFIEIFDRVFLTENA